MRGNSQQSQPAISKLQINQLQKKLQVNQLQALSR